MDRPSSSTRYNDASLRHKRTTSLAFPQITTENKFDESMSVRIDDFARINLSSRSPTSDSTPDYILPGIAQKKRYARPSSSVSNTLDLPRIQQSNRSRSSGIYDYSSHEDLRPRSHADGTTRRTRDSGLRDAHFAQSRHQVDPMQEDALFRPSNRESQMYTRSSAYDRQPPTGKSRSGHASRRRTTKLGTRPTSVSAAMEPDESPSRSAHAQKLLDLMETTHGSMEGELCFRHRPSKPWLSARCLINSVAGSLIAESTTGDKSQQYLIRNLRGCTVQSLLETDLVSPVLVVRPRQTPDVIYLRPEDPTQADAWLAALLCWEPIQAIESLSGRQPGRVLPSPSVEDKQTKANGRARKDAAIIKVGKVLYMDPSESIATSRRTSSNGDSSHHSDNPFRCPLPGWSHVSCTLRDNGELKLYTTAGISTLAKIRLSRLPRSAVQRLAPSVYGLDLCIAIHLELSPHGDACDTMHPMYLCFDTRVLFEVWFALLRAFTSPELYGPESSHSPSSLRSANPLPGMTPGLGPFWFRIERSLHLHIAEARLKSPLDGEDSEDGDHDVETPHTTHAKPVSHHVQISLDGHVCAKTTSKSIPLYPFWYENLDIIDIAPSTSSIQIQVMTTKIPGVATRSQKSSRGLFGGRRVESDMESEFEIKTDATHGVVLVDMVDVEPCEEVERWWPLEDEEGHAVGDVLVKLRLEREIILMDHEYHALSDLLHKNAGILTSQIAEKIPSELTRLSNCLLNIFQASGQAGDWLMSLAEEEIDGTRKDAAPGRYLFGGSLDPKEFADSVIDGIDAGDRASMVRDLTKTAMAEANLLFRGNTLLSKALDLHMKRLGKDYLESTIGAKLRAIADEDPDCEVDPNRITSGVGLQQNWQRLLSLTFEVWSLIHNSVTRCPTQLRIVFRHIRACTDDRYGERLRSVRYSSVSGFLFLRFFCPAILNPRIFGLMNDNPKPRTQRTLTLLAKSLQGLANQGLFGLKEAWMEPMNQFLSTHKQQFRDFIDAICTLPSPSPPTAPLPPAYSTPIAIFTRLLPASREGFPSLPYLIDSTRNFSALVNLWLDNFKEANAKELLLDADLAAFHGICLDLRRRTEESFRRAERVERRSSAIEERWKAIAERVETRKAAGGAERQDMRGAGSSVIVNDQSVGEASGSQRHSYGDVGGGVETDMQEERPFQEENAGREREEREKEGDWRKESERERHKERGKERKPGRESAREKERGSQRDNSKDATMFGLFGRRRRKKDEP